MRQCDICKMHNAKICENCPYPRKTLYQTIIAAPEVLAEKLVYLVRDSYNGAANYYWCSTVADGVWKTKQEAIAATVAELKEVGK